MKKEHRYIFERGSKKHHCPDCNKKTFVRYIDVETSDYLPEQYGRCDRESKCGYCLNPYLDGYAKAIWEQEHGDRSSFSSSWRPQQKKAIPQPEPEPIFFDFDTFRQTLNNYDKNTFIQNLLSSVQFPFEADEVTKVIELYRLGTVANGYRAGASTFPFIDKNDNVRAVQVKQFDEQNHTIGTDFLHSIIEKHSKRNSKPLPKWLEAYIKQDRRISCLFGEHLVSKYPNAKVCLFEAPKTAIYSTLYLGFPETSNIICLAVYNKSSFSFEKIKVLKGRFIDVFPDLSKDGATFNEWKDKADNYQKRLTGTSFIVSDLLERLATDEDKAKGNDFADVLNKLDWRTFSKHGIQNRPPYREPEKVIKVTTQQNIIFSTAEPLPSVEIFKTEQTERPKKDYHQSWSKEIVSLENYFTSIKLPTQDIRLNECNTIVDCSLFIESHLAIVKANNGNSYFLPYLNRLQRLKQLLNIKTN